MTKHQETAEILAGPPYRARYKSRKPNPGECVVQAIDWNDRRVTMSNGACTYFPEFEDIVIYRANAGGMARELAAPEMLKALLEIFANPGWQDPEVGYMSGHIAAHAIRKALGEEAGNAALGLSRQNAEAIRPESNP